MHLILAMIWLLAGGYFLVSASTDPESRLGPTPGYVSLALCGYNLLRWQMQRAQPARTTEPSPQARRTPRPIAHLFKLEDEPLPPPAAADSKPENPPRDKT